jgi:prepilin-type N-terminal cleavage/methylation domain-containing protein
MNYPKQQGFTLVELSIVLVIIGLLIGGILAAQSMINTTKIQAFVRQIGQFDAAIANFKDKFQSLPGDSVLFSSGDGNYLIEDDAGTGATFAGELPQAWANLAATGLKNEDGGAYTGTDDSIVVTGSTATLPKAKVGTNVGIILAGDDSATVADSGNFYYVADFGETDATNIDYNLSFTGNDSLSIDTKLDDGDPNVGNIMADDAAQDGATGLALFTQAGCPDTYTPGSTVAFVLRIRAGISHGDLY